MQIIFNPKRMIDLYEVRKARGVPSVIGSPGYLSDDSFIRVLLFEKIDDELLKQRK